MRGPMNGPMNGPVDEKHLDGAALVRYLDHEGPAADRARDDAHLRACAACAADLEALRDEADRVSRWLRRHDLAAPTTTAAAPTTTPGARSATPAAHSARGAWGGRGVGAIPTWLKAAAAILLVTAPAVAVPGVRDWVVERVAGPAAVADEDAAATAAAPAAPTDPEARLVRFVPAAGGFTVRFDAAEPGGTLRLGRADADEAVLRLESAAEPVVSSALLRIRNGGDAGARARGPAPGRYSLRMPAGTRGVRVVVAGTEVTVSAGELDRGVVIPLSEPDGR